MPYKCPTCGKVWPDTPDLARHIFGTGDQAHKEWVNSKGYKTLADLLEKEAEKVD